jgi:hypothetical protein
MIDPSLREENGFEWRVQTGRWRWVILGALGMAPLGCGGRTNRLDGESSGGTPTTGGSGGSPSSGGSTMAGIGGAGVAGMSTGGSAPTTHPSECEPPLTDLGGGWEKCSNGMLHRHELGSCASSVPRPDLTMDPHPEPNVNSDAGVRGECRSDSDCTEKPYGHCEWGPYTGATYCDYGCVTNADCDPGHTCLCGEPVGACRVASCATDAECGSGFLCSDYSYDPGCGGQGFACQRAADSCAADSDCGEFQYCARGSYAIAMATDNPRYCTGGQCVIGRPFLIAGHERLAPGVVRSDWYPASRSNEAAVALLDVELEAAIRRGWVEQALMEHASVAAFARFSLQLLALRAPPDLIARAASAMGDEIEHARACFELARRHGEDDVGPGELDMSGALESTALEAVVLGTIAEGCIGETLAAIEAAEACAHCEDGTARPVLERIARDETRHAELAWRFVAWGLEVGPEGLRERARAAFATATEHTGPALSAPAGLDRELARHGLIGGSLRVELRNRVLREVIAPCARALLDQPPGASVAQRGTRVGYLLRA